MELLSFEASVKMVFHVGPAQRKPNTGFHSILLFFSEDKVRQRPCQSWIWIAGNDAVCGIAQAFYKHSLSHAGRLSNISDQEM